MADITPTPTPTPTPVQDIINDILCNMLNIQKDSSDDEKLKASKDFKERFYNG